MLIYVSGHNHGRPEHIARIVNSETVVTILQESTKTYTPARRGWNKISPV